MGFGSQTGKLETHGFMSQTGRQSWSFVPTTELLQHAKIELFCFKKIINAKHTHGLEINPSK